MAEFSFEEVKEENLPILKALQENIREEYQHIYRQTTRGTKTLYSENYSTETEVTKIIEEAPTETASKSSKRTNTSKPTKKRVAEAA